MQAMHAAGPWTVRPLAAGLGALHLLPLASHLAAERLTFIAARVGDQDGVGLRVPASNLLGQAEGQGFYQMMVEAQLGVSWALPPILDRMPGRGTRTSTAAWGGAGGWTMPPLGLGPAGIRVDWM
ncbi:hypothetical protein D7D52_17570 [Nocardia yunnanensis]|uniref:Uncharacterized protein n=1 Tax=Nocardia yunnanensis TaxID=2382165 RepID=A0A386ZCH7_9NOCA|nr:hypothetical protein [Nocardia yunnanensis]AYF75371.1 hypothetical protein D7D52_17570 [Nocardia yunnanensis]